MEREEWCCCSCLKGEEGALGFCFQQWEGRCTDRKVTSWALLKTNRTAGWFKPAAWTDLWPFFSFGLWQDRWPQLVGWRSSTCCQQNSLPSNQLLTVVVAPLILP